MPKGAARFVKEAGRQGHFEIRILFLGNSRLMLIDSPFSCRNSEKLSRFGISKSMSSNLYLGFWHRPSFPL
jgi:hypothetical protein